MNHSKICILLISTIMFIGGCSQRAYNTVSPDSSVGTAWGKDVHSTVTGVDAQRLYRDPANVVSIRYSAEFPANYDRVYSIRAGDVEYAIRDVNFNSLPIAQMYDSSTRTWQYVIPAPVGLTYQLYIRNYSYDTNYEIVATVDGLDVLNGKPGSFDNNGYIVNAGQSLTIKGFRKDRNHEAAFQFSRVADSYAANSAYGDTNNAGVIGFAAFELAGKTITTLPPCASQAFPASKNGYAPPPCKR